MSSIDTGMVDYFNSTVHLREPFTGPRFIALSSGPNRAARRAVRRIGARWEWARLSGRHRSDPGRG